MTGNMQMMIYIAKIFFMSIQVSSSNEISFNILNALFTSFMSLTTVFLSDRNRALFALAGEDGALDLTLLPNSRV